MLIEIIAAGIDAEEPETMGAIFKSVGSELFSVENSIAEAVEKGKKQGELLVVCGSFYIMQEALKQNS